MTRAIIAFMVMLNPFALFLYLLPVMRELSPRDFVMVVFRASFISFGIFLFFLITGVLLFRDVLQIRFESSAGLSFFPSPSSLSLKDSAHLFR